MRVTDMGSLFLPSELSLIYLFAFIGCYWLSSVHTPHLSRWISIPPSHVEDGSLRCVITRGGSWGGGVVLLFRSENDELVQEAKKKIRAVFPHMSAWLCLLQMRTILVLDVWRSVYSVWRAMLATFEKLGWDPLTRNKPNAEAKNMTALRLDYLATNNGPSNTLHINQQLLVSTLVPSQSTEELDVFQWPLCSILL